MPSQGHRRKANDIVVRLQRPRRRTKLYLVNVLEHHGRQVAEARNSARQHLNGNYKGDPAVGKFLEVPCAASASQRRRQQHEPPTTSTASGRVRQQDLQLLNSRPPVNANSRSDAPTARMRNWTIKTAGGQGFLDGFPIAVRRIPPRAP